MTLHRIGPSGHYKKDPAREEPKILGECPASTFLFVESPTKRTRPPLSVGLSRRRTN